MSDLLDEGVYDLKVISQAPVCAEAAVIFYKNGAALELNENGKAVLRSADVDSTPYYMEAEINSPMIELQPGDSYAMDTNWWPTRADHQMRGLTSAGVILTPLTVAASNNSVLLSGSFGVFFPVMQAHVFDSQGVERQAFDLQSVEPQTCAEPRREVKLSQAISSGFYLVDDQGIDRWQPGETAIPSARF